MKIRTATFWPTNVVECSHFASGLEACSGASLGIPRGPAGSVGGRGGLQKKHAALEGEARNAADEKWREKS